MTEKILQSELVINAADKTGSVFEKVGDKIDRLAQAGRHVDGLSSQFKTLGNHVEGVGRHLDGLHGKMRQVETLGTRLGKVIGPLAASFAAFEGARGVRAIGGATAKATAEGAHERVRMETGGMTPAEIREAEASSARLTGEFKPVSQTAILHLLRNARSIVGTYEEAEKIIEPLLKTYMVAMGAHPQHREELEGDFDKLVKGMEIKGVTQNLPAFQRYLNGMSKALNVFGDTLRPTDYYEMFKYGRQATQGLSEKFMLSTAPTFAQEMGGSSAGKAFSSFFQAIVGGRMKQAAVVEFGKLGLLDPTKIIKTKTGATKGVMPGGIRGSALAASDPYEWVNQIFLPALKKHGITDPSAIAEHIAAAFQAGTAAQLVQILATQQSRITKDWALVEHAQGSEAATTFMSKDPYVAMHAVTEQLTNLFQAAGSPLAQPAADALNATAAALHSLYEAATEHPKAAGAGFIAALSGGALASYEAAILAAGKFGWMAPETAAMWARAPLAAAAGMAPLLPTLPLAAPFLAETLFPGWGMDRTPFAGPTLAKNLAAQSGGKLSDIYRRNFDEERQRLGIDQRIDIHFDNEMFDAKVRSIVRDERGTLSGTTGSTGKTMPEAGTTPYFDH